MIYQENNQCFALSIPPRIEIRGILETVMSLAFKRQFSVFYHDIFNYPLTNEEINFWCPGKKFKDIRIKLEAVEEKDGFFYLKGKESLVVQRAKRQKLSAKKIEIAKKGADAVSFVPFVKLVGVSGALAMKNTEEDADIDLIIICKKCTLWITRLLVIFALDALGIPRRKAGDREEKDKLCLNMWMDEGDLVWDREDRNFYTAHEIAQILPLVNKDKTYERFIYLNRWVREYWPDAVGQTKEMREKRTKERSLIFSVLNFFIYPLEFVAFWVQYIYMKSKITREVVTPTRAIFHPRDWGKVVKLKLQRGV